MNCNIMSAQTRRPHPPMAIPDAISRDIIDARIDGAVLRIAAAARNGDKTPILALHGFGSTKEDYADLLHNPLFSDHQIIIYDAPGCGQSECDNPAALSIPALCAAARRVIEHYGLDRFHLIGHSMGGLTALMLAREAPQNLLSFANIEGNLAPEDCFLSRQIETHPADDPQAFLAALADRIWRRKSSADKLYAASLAHKVRAEATGPIFRSMIEISDRENLLEDFIGLPCPKLLVYGAENNALSYLGDLARRNVQLAEIAHSGHFPMYSNPPALWTRIGEFIQQAQSDGDDGS